MTHENSPHALKPPRISHDQVNRAWKKFLRRHGYKVEDMAIKPIRKDVIYDRS